MRYLLLLTLTTLLAGGASAQEPAADSRPDPIEATREMVKAMGIVDPANPDLAEEILGPSSSELPEAAQRALVEALSEESMIDRLIPAYLTHFTLDEIRAITEFYKSPVGRKLVEKQPLIMESFRTSTLDTMMRIGASAQRFLEDSTSDAPLVQKAKQKKTVLDLRNVGYALMSWLVDQAGSEKPVELPPAEGRSAWQVAGEAGAPTASYFLIPYETLESWLVPKYIQSLPAEDGWGHPLQFALNDNLLGKHIFGVRSPGRNGTYEQEAHVPGPFDLEDFDHDIVWVDGYFLQWPEGPESRDTEVEE